MIIKLVFLNLYKIHLILNWFNSELRLFNDFILSLNPSEKRLIQFIFMNFLTHSLIENGRWIFFFFCRECLFFKFVVIAQVSLRNLLKFNVILVFLRFFKLNHSLNKFFIVLLNISLLRFLVLFNLILILNLIKQLYFHSV